MRTPLAWQNLTYQKIRTLVAVAGVAFALILIFMQLGFYGTAEATATLIYEKVDFDLALISPEYLNTNLSGSFPRRHISSAKAVEGVASAVPFHVGVNMWLSPEEDPDVRVRRQIMLLGVNPRDHVFQFPDVEAVLPLLNSPGPRFGFDPVLMDRLSRYFLGDSRPGTTTELGGRRIEIVGQFSLGSGFAADGLLIVSEEVFSRLQRRSLDRVSVGLVKIEPGYSHQAVADYLSEILPQDVLVLTNQQLVARETRYWVEMTSVGIIFRMGVTVALIAGAVFVYQVISSDVRQHLKEYATLKAIGYSSKYLYGIVTQQAIILALLSYLPGLLVSLVLYEITRQVAVVPMHMTLNRMAFVLLLGLCMCLLSGIFASRKVQTADPADVFG